MKVFENVRKEVDHSENPALKKPDLKQIWSVEERFAFYRASAVASLV